MFAASHPSVCCFTPHFCWLKPSKKILLVQTYDQTPGLSYSNFQGLLNALGVGHQPQAQGPEVNEMEKMLKGWESSFHKLKNLKIKAGFCSNARDLMLSGKHLTNHHQQSGHPGGHSVFWIQKDQGSHMDCFSMDFPRKITYKNRVYMNSPANVSQFRFF